MPRIPRAVCTDCGYEMRIKKNDHVLQAVSESGPYYKVASDLYACPGCGHEIAIGFARDVLSESYHLDFDAVAYDGEFRFAEMAKVH